MSEPTNKQQNGVIKSADQQQQRQQQKQKLNSNSLNIIYTSNKPKLFKIKEGELLHYKRKLFTRNWRPAQLILYNNGSFLISSRRNSTTPALIKCEKNSTLIIFGQQLDFIPKRPSPPSGNKLEHMLAVGLISCNGYTNAGKMKGTQIVFYWFSMSSQEDLVNWVVAFQNSIYSNFSTVKPNQDIQTVTNNIALNNAASIANLNNNLNKNTNNSNDGFALGLLMANTSAFPDSFNFAGAGAGLATAGAAGFVAANSQYQTILDNDRLGSNSIFLNPLSGRGTNRIPNSFLDSSGYMQDDSLVAGDEAPFANLDSSHAGFSNELNNLASNLQFAEMDAVMNAADYIDCSMGDCSIGMDGGNVDCGGDFAFAFAI